MELEGKREEGAERNKNMFTRIWVAVIVCLPTENSPG
jgi:hypothetical protein